MASRHPGATEMLVGFELGLYSRTDVGDWVTVEVDRHEVLVDPLLDLTTLNGKHDVDVAHLLRDLAGNPDVRVEAPIGIAVLGEMLRRKQRTCRNAIAQAARIAEDLSRDEHGAALGLEDELQLAEDGVYGVVSEVERAVVAFFSRYELGR